MSSMYIVLSSTVLRARHCCEHVTRGKFSHASPALTHASIGHALSHSSLWHIHPHAVDGRLDKRSIEREGRPRVSGQHAVVESDTSRALLTAYKSSVLSASFLTLVSCNSLALPCTLYNASQLRLCRFQGAAPDDDVTNLCAIIDEMGTRSAQVFFFCPFFFFFFKHGRTLCPPSIRLGIAIRNICDQLACMCGVDAM